jgi:hypothetical protein
LRFRPRTWLIIFVSCSLVFSLAPYGISPNSSKVVDINSNDKVNAPIPPPHLLSWDEDINQNLSSIKFYRNGIKSMMDKSLPIDNNKIANIASMYYSIFFTIL